MRVVDEGKQKLVGILLAAGVASFLVGLFFSFLALVFQSTFFFVAGPLLALLGLAMAGSGLFMGLRHTGGLRGGAARPEEEARVVARFAINEIGEMIFDNFEYDAENARYYVRLQYLDGRREELECAKPVMDFCGEGMRGLVLVQGGWLSRFVPLADTDETREAYRAW